VEGGVFKGGKQEAIQGGSYNFKTLNMEPHGDNRKVMTFL